MRNYDTTAAPSRRDPPRKNRRIDASRLLKQLMPTRPAELDAAETLYLSHAIARNFALLQQSFVTETSWFADAIRRSGAVTKEEQHLAMAREFSENAPRFEAMLRDEERINRIFHRDIKRLTAIRKAQSVGKAA